MSDYQLGAVEAKFADIIWENEPISSPELVRKSAEELRWKKSTTCTVLKRLCGKGIFQSQKGVVTSLLSRQEFYALQSENFVKENFNGSLPAFLAAFSSRQNLTDRDVALLRRMVEEYVEEYIWRPSFSHF